MLFNSLEFILLFLPATLLVYYAIVGTGRWQLSIAWLILSSLFFYAYWNPIYLLLILGSVTINYSFGLWISNANASIKTWLLSAGIIINLGLLFYFKYANAFVDASNYVGITDFELSPIILPLAISFFTFQQIAYLVDAAKNKVDSHSFSHYFVFVVFFPQLIAGPIVHHRDVIRQFVKRLNKNAMAINIAMGLSLFVFGLFKKVVLADNFAVYSDEIYLAAEAGVQLDFIQAWQAIIAFIFQLYFDFSGYSDMAIGLARMFGIRLPINFNSPYSALNIVDLWKRWNMTLTSFFKHYLFIPISRGVKSKTIVYINMMITMLLTGIWHGSNLTFVYWGIMHGFGIIGNHLWRRVYRKKIDTWWSRFTARSLTFLFFMLSCVFIRAETVDGAMAVFEGLTHLPASWQANVSWLASGGFAFDGANIEKADSIILVALIVFTTWAWVLPNSQYMFRRYYPSLRPLTDATSYAGMSKRLAQLKWRPNAMWAFITAMLAIASVLNISKAAEFIYFQF